MFLTAVYYFVGMSRLPEALRDEVTKAFEGNENQATIRPFFSRFQAATNKKYKEQVEAILEAQTYKDMAPKFMDLFASIRAGEQAFWAGMARAVANPEFPTSHPHQ